MSEKEATKSYQVFRRNLRKRWPYLAADLCEVYSPGDAKPPFIRVLWYQWKIAPAKKSGLMFGRYVRDRKGPNADECTKIIIAHSLGCRMTLEALRELQAAGVRATIVLMAAAVPVHMLYVGMPLRKAVEAVCPTRNVLYSHSDQVLTMAFRMGQSLASGEGFLPVAVGREGDPVSLWSEKRHMHGYGHGDYWSEASTTDVIAELLGEPADRRLEARSAAPPRSIPPYSSYFDSLI